MFDNKKDAEEHDKMLELAANITHLIEQHVDIGEKQSEAIGLLLAEHREKLAQACKGKPSVLITEQTETHKPRGTKEDGANEGNAGNKITALAANQ